MQKIFATLLFSALILGACSTGVTSPQAVPASTTEGSIALPTTAVPNPKLILTVGTPHIDQPADPAADEVTPISPTPLICTFQWANKDLPELSSSLQQSIQALQPEAQASAFAFGENCVGWGGNIISFSAMETNFDIYLQVDDLANESVLGKWIVQVMEVIENIPAEQIAGPRLGRVSIVFQSSTAQSVINFDIAQYKQLPPNFNYAEIYEALKTLQ